MKNYHIIYEDANDNKLMYFTISSTAQNAVNELRKKYGNDVRIITVGITVTDWK